MTLPAILVFLVSSRLTRTRRKDDPNNEAIEGKSFSKDEDENHPYKQFGLLCVGSATNINNDTLHSKWN